MIADDLTGAQEMGALLTSRHLRTLVTTRLQPSTCHLDAVVIDTESRNLAPELAAERIHAAAASLRLHRETPVFKKIDSTLRGPIGAELRALSPALGGRPVLLTPAYPQLGRVVREGRLLVNGLDVSRTEFGRDPRWPVVDSHVSHVLQAGCDPIQVCDAESELDLKAIVARASRGTILAGSGGLGRAWVDNLPAGDHPPASTFHPRRPLVVSGSRHPISLDQVRRASAIGIETVAPARDESDPNRVMQRVAADAHKAVKALDPDLLVLFGGETAASVLDRLGMHDLFPIRELTIGIVVSLSWYGAKEIMIVTKAGGFGEPRIMEYILRQLQ